MLYFSLLQLGKMVCAKLESAQVICRNDQGGRQFVYVAAYQIFLATEKGRQFRY